MRVVWGMCRPKIVTFTLLQEGIPLRIYQIHFLNASAFTNKIMKFLKPMMKEELWNMVSS